MASFSGDGKAEERRVFAPLILLSWPGFSKLFNHFFSLYADKQRAIVVDWLNCILPHLNLPAKASVEELRACLIDGTVLCRFLNRLRPGSVSEICLFRSNYCLNFTPRC